MSDQKQYPHKLADVLEDASKDERSRKHFVNADENKLNHKLGGDRLSKAIFDIGKNAMLVPIEPKPEVQND